MLETLSGFIIHFIQSGGYAGIFALVAIGSSVFPIPSEIVLPFSGFLIFSGKLNYFLVVPIAVIADVLGSLIPYYAGYYLEEKLILNLIKKHGKYILLSEREYEHASNWFKKYGDKMVLIGKMLPGVRWIISLPAGVFEMSVWKFLTYATIGSIIYSSLLTFIGVYLGTKWQSLSGYFHQLEVVIMILLVLLFIWYLDHKLEIRKKLFKK